MFRPTVRVMRRLLVLSIALLPAGLPGPAVAGDELPTVGWVLERYVTATGGREALLRHRSMTVHGRNYERATKREVSGVFYTKDGKSLQVVTLPAGMSQSGYD